MEHPAARPVLTPLGFGYLSVFAGAAMVNLVVATTWVRADHVALISTVLWVGSLMAAALTRPHRMGWLVAAWLVSALLMMAAVQTFWPTVLQSRGERIEATVTSLRDGGEKGRHLYYRLAGPDGQPIAGELGQWPGSVPGASNNPEGAVGSQVSVIVDPEGLVDPRLPAELAEAEAIWVVLVFLFGVTALLCVIAGRPTPVRQTRARERRPRGRDRRAARGGSAPDRR